MKKTSLFLAVIGMVLSLTGADAKRLTVSVNSITTQEVPFKIENISVSDETIAKITTVDENNREFRITGKKSGIVDVQVRGGGMNQTFKITVIANLELLLKDLKFALDAVPEVEIAILNDRLVLKGEISSIANLELKNKVVKAYQGSIMDLTTFRPTPEVMIALHKNLEKAGYKVVRKGTAKEPGEIAITQVGEMLTITGTVYGPEDLKKINSILTAQPWLSINADNKGKGAATNRVQAYVNVQVLPVMLQVDIVHVAVSKEEAKGMGVDWSAFVNNGFGVGTNLMYALQKVRGADTIKTANSAIGAGTNGTLQAWLQLMGSNSITRVRRAGFLTFKSNDTPEFRKLHNGGTFVISSNAGVGSTSQLKEYDYGLILQVKGGLTGYNTVSIELKQELSYPGPISKFVNDAKLELKKFETSTSFTSKLGETIAISGMKEFTQANANTGSIPYLRNVPVLKWVIAQENDTFKDDEIITLICVHKMIPSGSVDPVAVELDKMKQAEDKKERERVRQEHKNDGKWYQFWKW